jgi:tryptophan halogenase
MKYEQKAEEFIIAGGGTAGWITAAMIASMFSNCKITLIENSKIGTIGVGESTTPAILDFLSMCNIDIRDFIKHTESTIKVGINFENWTADKSSYLHSFELVRNDQQGSIFGYDYLHKFLKDDHPYNYFAEKNVLPISDTGELIGSHALHINAIKFVEYLKSFLGNKVNVIDDKIISVNNLQNKITDIQLESGVILSADIFFDCTGFKRVLHSELGSEWKSCKDILPVDSAIPCPFEWNNPMNTTHSTALDEGWVWQVPLQTRMGSGYVYSSEFAKDPEKTFVEFIKNKYGKIISPDRIIKFDSGYVTNPWKGNVICVGLSSGFVEPLESTSIHMIYHQVLSFIHAYDGLCTDNISYMYNKNMQDMYDDTVAFIKLHYIGKQGKNDFWNYMAEPNCEKLNTLLDLWKHHLPTTDHICQNKNETPGYRLFAIIAWLQVMQGMKLIPKDNIKRFIHYNEISETDCFRNNLITQDMLIKNL